MELISGTAQTLTNLSNSTTRYSILFKSAGITTQINKVESYKPTALVHLNANNLIVITQNNDYKCTGYVTIFNAFGQEIIKSEAAF